MIYRAYIEKTVTTQNILLRIWVILHGRRENEFFNKLSFKLQPKKAAIHQDFDAFAYVTCVFFFFIFGFARISWHFNH